MLYLNTAYVKRLQDKITSTATNSRWKADKESIDLSKDQLSNNGVIRLYARFINVNDSECFSQKVSGAQ